MNRHSTFPRLAAPMMASLLALAGCGSHPAGDDAATPATPPAASSAGLALQTFLPESGAGVITSCNIEALDQATFQADPLTADRATAHTLSGWVAAPALAHPAYWLRLEDKAQGRHYQLALTLSVKRPDVVAANQAGVPLLSGFHQPLPLLALPAGLYHAYLAAVDGPVTSLCDNGRQIELK